jgi:hypothetical protein
MNHFCTIITPDFLKYALALHTSLSKFMEHQLHILVVKAHVDRQALPENCIAYSLDDLKDLPLSNQIASKYEDKTGELIWSLKSVFMLHLLKKPEIDKLFFCDPDLFFFNSPAFLFDLLDDNRMILSPHFRCADPKVNEGNFLCNFTDGMYNGGFIGVNKDAIEILDWWGKACLYTCEREHSKGLFMDQKYLDFIPSRFNGVVPILHQGCNVANWNMNECIREKKGDRILINGKFEIIFIHFSQSTIFGILKKVDALLEDHLRHYQQVLKQVDPKHIDVFESFNYSNWSAQSKGSLVRRIIRKIIG